MSLFIDPGTVTHGIQLAGRRCFCLTAVVGDDRRGCGQVVAHHRPRACAGRASQGAYDAEFCEGSCRTGHPENARLLANRGIGMLACALLIG